MLVFLGLGRRGLFRSMTHWGGGGGLEDGTCVMLSTHMLITARELSNAWAFQCR